MDNYTIVFCNPARNFIDPENKQSTVVAFKSDTSPDQLISAVKELLLLGNYGRMSGFPLLRAAVEVFMTRELFDTEKSKRYKNCKIKFIKTIPSVTSICKIITRLGFDQKLGPITLSEYMTLQV